LSNAAFIEVLRLIREVEPPRPSTRLSDSEELPLIAAKRKLEPKKLTRLVSGDLDWIVMKALEKERSRRYETANGLAMDIERYLHEEPVLAGPPSAAYRFRKFLRRNKGPVAAASLLVVALLAGVVGTSVGLVQAEDARHAEARQRRQAEDERDQKEVARRAAVTNERLAVDNETKAKQAEKEEREAKDLAQRRQAQIEKANDILASIFQDLDPRQAEKEGLPLSAQLGQRLDKAAALLEGEAVGDSLVVARLQFLLGKSQANLGYAERGINLLTRARVTLAARLGPDHPETLTCIASLAYAYQAAGQWDQALLLFQETLTKRQAKLGPDHPDTLLSMNNLASAYASAGRLDRSIPLLEKVLALHKARYGPDHPARLQILANLGAMYRQAKRLDEAIHVLEVALSKYKAKPGPDHPDTFACMDNLASAYQDAGQLDKALPLFEQTLEKTRAKLGPYHPDTLRSMNNLAGACWQAGQRDKTLALYEETLAKAKAKLGPEHPYTLRTMTSLAEAYQAAGQFAKAEPLLLQAYEGLKKQGKTIPAAVSAQHLTEVVERLVQLFEATGKKNEAVKWRQQLPTREKQP
jgi:tetratricopeptide (TPR) repeat protein